MFDAGLAISLFHDAVEMTMFACGARFDAQLKDRAPFTDLLDAVAKAAIQAGKPALRLKLEMDRLNKTRVNFKHYGLRPDRRDAESHRIDAGEFLAFAAREYFDVDFAGLSLVSFVSDDAERAALEKALELLQTDNKDAALSKCSESFEMMAERRAQFYRRGILITYDQVEHTIKDYVDRHIAELRGHIWDIESLVFAGMCGVSPMDLLVLRNILPKRYGNESKYENVPLEVISPEAVARCIDLLAHYSIGLSDQLAAPSRVIPGADWLY